MINQNKWVDSLPIKKVKFGDEINQVDRYRWVNTISNKNTYNVVNKYSIMTILFVCGLLFVSIVKNETRNLEKKINNLRASNNIIKFNLDQTILDNQIITSPDYISKLAREHLNTNFVSYKKKQIQQLDGDTGVVIEPEKIKKINKKLSENIKLEIEKKIEKKKTEIRKLQELYAKPETIPGEIKTQVSKKIEEKKTELKKLYTAPKETITLQKVQKWAAVQVVKVFLGMPVIPGK